MQKLVFLFILMAYTKFITAQQQPYRYDLEVKYKMTNQTDSTNPNSINYEFMTLLIGKEQSVFLPTQYLIMDSFNIARKVNGAQLSPVEIMQFLNTNGTKNWLIVFKNLSYIITYDKLVRFIIPQQVYMYNEPKDELHWEILNDTISIAGISCQKAAVDFGGRHWIAWFAPSIPISEGPYKFNGLPGLIMKIQDNQNYWNFDLASIKGVDTLLRINFKNHNVLPIKNKETFFKQRRNSISNRFILMKQNGWKFSNEGLAIKQYIEESKKDNNWIELYKDDKE